MIAVMRVAVLSLAFALAVPVCLPSQDSSREQAVASLDALVRQLDELRARVADAREAVDQERDDVAAARSLQTVHEQVTRLAREFSDGTLKVRMVLDPIRTKLSDAGAIYEMIVWLASSEWVTAQQAQLVVRGVRFVSLGPGSLCPMDSTFELDTIEAVLH